MTRQEHLQWAKNRAMEYVASGDLKSAFTLMCSDLAKHPETEMHASTNQFGMELLLNGHLSTREQMTAWIQGYN